MRKPESKCLNCKDRYPGCHSKCESYNEFLKASEEYRGILHEAHGKRDIEMTMSVKMKERYYKYKKQMVGK